VIGTLVATIGEALDRDQREPPDVERERSQKPQRGLGDWSSVLMSGPAGPSATRSCQSSSISGIAFGPGTSVVSIKPCRFQAVTSNQQRGGHAGSGK